MANDSVHARDQHRCLTEMLDPTAARLAQTGVTAGWHCLDVGAGGAAWPCAAGRVAPSGRVLATDIKPGHIPASPGLEVTRHDIVHDRPCAALSSIRTTRGQPFRALPQEVFVDFPEVAHGHL